MFKPIKTTNTSTLTTKVAVPQTTIKQLVTKSPFIYGAKKTSFKVKRRKTYWEQIENVQTTIKQQLIKSLLLDKSDTKEDITLKAVSPVLALTLILLNQGVERTKTIDDYVGDIDDTSNNRFNPKVYAYNKYTYETDGSHTENATESYVPSLPQYYHIHGAWVSKGDLPSNKGINVFRTDGSNTGLSQKQIDVRNYFWEQGYLRKIANNSNGNKNTDISYLRSGYGYGPVCISTFLKLAKRGKKMIPEVICGLLLCEDSGMTLKDAMQAVREFVNLVNISKSSPFSYLSGLSEIMILSILEEIGTFFLLSLLGQCYKKNIRFAIPLSSSTEKNIYEVGYLLGDTISDLRNYLNYIIQNNLYRNDSIEVFSITSPCVMTSDGTAADSILETTFTTEIFRDLTTASDNPITNSFNVPNTLDDLKELEYFVQPRSGYSVSDFINNNLSKHYIEELIGFFNNSNIVDVNGDVIKSNIFSDHGIAPRVEVKETPGEFKFDYSKCTPLYDNEYYDDCERINSLSNVNLSASIEITYKDGITLPLTSGVDLSNNSIELKIGNDGKIDKIKVSVNVDDPTGKISNSNKSNIAKYIETLINTQITTKGVTMKYGNLTNEGHLQTDSTAIIQLPDITIERKYFFDTGEIILFSDDSLTVKFSNATYATATINGNVSWKIPSNQTTHEISYEGINSDDKFKVSCIVIGKFPVKVNPKALINRLFRDNNCTLELYYKNIDSVTTDNDKIEQINYFFDVYGLAVSRIIIINCLSSESRLMNNDVWRNFFKTFSGFLRNYLDIETSSLH